MQVAEDGFLQNQQKSPHLGTMSVKSNWLKWQKMQLLALELDYLEIIKDFSSITDVDCADAPGVWR